MINVMQIHSNNNEPSKLKIKGITETENLKINK